MVVLVRESEWGNEGFLVIVELTEKAGIVSCIQLSIGISGMN